MSKNETDSKKAHRIFKTYKATGEFPTDISPLDCYALMSKFNYFITEKLDKTIISKLTELCNILDRERVVLLFGDCFLNTVKFGLQSFKWEEKRQIKFVYIDCLFESPLEMITNATSTASHFGSYVIYLLDNAEYIKAGKRAKKGVKLGVAGISIAEKGNKYNDVERIVSLKDSLQGTSNAIVLLAFDLEKVNVTLRNGLKRIRIGKDVVKRGLKHNFYCLVCDQDRDKALNYFQQGDLVNSYFLKLVAFNIPTFYSDPTTIKRNINTLEFVSSLLYKVNSRRLSDYLVTAWIPSKVKRVIRFPPKEEQKNAVKRDLKFNAKKQSRKKGYKKENKRNKRSLLNQ